MQKMLDLLNDVHFFRATDTTARYKLVVVSRAVRTNYFSKTFCGQIHLHRSLSAFVPTFQYLLTFRYLLIAAS